MIIFAMTSCNKYYKATLGSTGDNTATTIDGLVHAKIVGVDNEPAHDALKSLTVCSPRILECAGVAAQQ